MKRNSSNTADDRSNSTRNILVEHPIVDPDVKQVNGKHTEMDDDLNENEEDLVLGDVELAGDEEEYEIELEEDMDEEDMDDDDLIINVDEDEDEGDEDL